MQHFYFQFSFQKYLGTKVEGRYLRSLDHCYICIFQFAKYAKTLLQLVMILRICSANITFSFFQIRHA